MCLVFLMLSPLVQLLSCISMGGGTGGGGGGGGGGGIYSCFIAKKAVLLANAFIKKVSSLNNYYTLIAILDIDSAQQSFRQSVSLSVMDSPTCWIWICQDWVSTYLLAVNSNKLGRL